MYTELDLIGLFVFAVSGALLAIHRDFDVVGIAILALITALGGGILRDLVLGDTPPPAFTQWEYLVVPLAASAVACVAHPELERLTQTLLVFDAAGLGLFCVAGTVKALEYGLPPVAAASLGVTTAVGGGVLRDVIARETPALVRPDSELYAVPAVAGAIGVVIAWELDAYEPALGAAIAAAVFAIRGLALRYHWRGPRAWQREHDARIPADSSGAVVIPDAQINEVLAQPRSIEPADAAFREGIALERIPGDGRVASESRGAR
jgi:uncharacterized membrane protein YeiH